MGQNRPGLDIRSLCYHNSVLTACCCLLLPVHPHASAFTGMHGPFAPTAPEGGKSTQWADARLLPDSSPCSVFKKAYLASRLLVDKAIIRRDETVSSRSILQ